MIYCSNYKIGLEDIGRNNEATNKALLAIMQDIACLHSASVGYGVLSANTLMMQAWDQFLVIRDRLLQKSLKN